MHILKDLTKDVLSYIHNMLYQISFKGGSPSASDCAETMEGFVELKICHHTLNVTLEPLCAGFLCNLHF